MRSCLQLAWPLNWGCGSRSGACARHQYPVLSSNWSPCSSSGDHSKQPFRMAAAQRLMTAMAAVNKEDWTAAALAQLHADALPAARRLAPLTGGRPLTPAEVKVPGKTPLSGHVLGSLAWVVRGLREQHFTANEELRQQASELLCALADVLVWALVVDETRLSSSRSGEGTPFGRLLRNHDDVAERVISTFMETAVLLKHLVFERTASVSPQLLLVAGLCFQNMAHMLMCWNKELVQPGGTPERPEQCYKLLRWCLDSGLLLRLSEGYLLVLGMDPAPFLARGPPGLEDLTNTVLLAMNGGQKLQGFVMSMVDWCQQFGDQRRRTPLLLVAQHSGNEGDTAHIPFLRLMLLWLAICQHWRRSAALTPGSMPNRPRATSEAVAALRAALQQQLTPSCAAQLVQRVAPAYWAVVTEQTVPKQYHSIITQMGEDLGLQSIFFRLYTLGAMVDLYDTKDGRPCWTLGPQELQVVMECAELDAATSGRPAIQWRTLEAALKACPYPALVTFTTQHSHTLLTLAERSFEAAVARDAGAASAGSSSSSSSRDRYRNRSRGTQVGGAAKMEPMAVALALAGCLARCPDSFEEGGVSAAGAGTCADEGNPADAPQGLLDSSTAPRLMRLAEALLRETNCGCRPGQDMCTALPGNLPEMALFYSSPSTARATLCVISSLAKWLQGSAVALAMLLQHPTDTEAAVEATLAALGERLGGAVAPSIELPTVLWRSTLDLGCILAAVAVAHLGRAALLLDSVTYEAAAAAAAAATSVPGGSSSSSRAWFMEQALLASQQPALAVAQEGDPCDLAAYKALLAAADPQLLQDIAKELQPEVTAMHRAATARQAAQLAKKHGTDTAAIAEQLQAVWLGVVGSSAGDGPPAAAAAAARMPAAAEGGDCSTAASSPGGVPPVTPGDVTVAANTLLAGCKAAGALLGVLPMLEGFVTGGIGYKLMPGDGASLAFYAKRTRQLSDAVYNLAEWALLLHPLLAQVLPAAQSQVLVGLAGRLTGSSGSSSSSSSSSSSGEEGQQPSMASSKLSDEEVAAVLGALQHVVIPGQPGCSNPRCCCMYGLSEATMQTQVCVACRGARYCSPACQRAHWRAGHKEVCKAVQAAAKAAAEAAVGCGLEQEQDG